jgi:AcrR family transcriptional regulator
MGARASLAKQAGRGRAATSSARSTRKREVARASPLASGGVRELRRAQILAAARALVAAEGLEALTFGALEERLGFSRGVITYHFADKDEVAFALLKSAIVEIDAGTDVALSRSSTLEEKVRAVLASKARGFLEKQEAARVLLSFWGRAGRDARARKVHGELFARYRAEAASLAKLARKERPERTGKLDPDAFGALLVGAIIGLAVQAILQPDAFVLDLAIEEAARAFCARLRGA